MSRPTRRGDSTITRAPQKYQADRRGTRRRRMPPDAARARRQGRFPA